MSNYARGLVFTNPLPNSTITERRPQIRGTSKDTAFVRIMIDDLQIGTGTSVNPVGTFQRGWNASPGVGVELPDGDHTVQAFDEEDNVIDSASFTVVVDGNPPPMPFLFEDGRSFLLEDGRQFVLE